MTKLDRLSGFGGVGPGLDTAGATQNYTEETYRLWACDNQIYGPVQWPLLVEWAREGRVQRDSWVYLEGAQEWHMASKIAPLHDCFPPSEETMFLHRQAAQGGIAPEELRQFAVLSSLSNNEL